jgi:hypothetical protein
MTFNELSARATPRPYHTDGDGQIYGPNPEFDPTDLQTHDEILIADVAPENVALTEYDADNAAFLVHCANNFERLVDALKSLLPGWENGCKEAWVKEAQEALAAAQEVK